MAELLSAAELTALRADVLGLLPGTAIISRLTTSVGTAGFPARTYAAVGTAVCRLDPVANRSAGGGIVASQDALAYYRTLTVPYNTDLRANDRVTIDTRVYSVTRLDDDHDARIVRRAEMVKADL